MSKTLTDKGYYQRERKKTKKDRVQSGSGNGIVQPRVNEVKEGRVSSSVSFIFLRVE